MAIVLLPSGDQFFNVEGQCRGLNKLLPQVLTDIPFTYHCVCVCGEMSSEWLKQPMLMAVGT